MEVETWQRTERSIMSHWNDLHVYLLILGWRLIGALAWWNETGDTSTCRNSGMQFISWKIIA